MSLLYSPWQSSEGTACFGQAIVKILADCGIIQDDATQISKVFHCVEVDAINADLRRTVRFSLRGLIQNVYCIVINISYIVLTDVCLRSLGVYIKFRNHFFRFFFCCRFLVHSNVSQFKVLFPVPTEVSHFSLMFSFSEWCVQLQSDAFSLKSGLFNSNWSF